LASGRGGGSGGGEGSSDGNIARIILSSGAANKTELVKASGMSPSNVVLDRRAVCTVTNMTTLVAELSAEGVTHVELTTSRAHMRRAHPVGALVMNSFGIHVEPRPVEFDDQNEMLGGRESSPESRVRMIRDVLRVVLWLMTGWDGGRVAVAVHPYRANSVYGGARLFGRESGEGEGARARAPEEDFKNK